MSAVAAVLVAVIALSVFLRQKKIRFELEYLTVFTLVIHREVGALFAQHRLRLVERDPLQPGVERPRIVELCDILPRLDEGEL